MVPPGLVPWRTFENRERFAVVPEWLNDCGVVAGVLRCLGLMPGTELVMSVTAKTLLSPIMERGEQENFG